MFVPLGTCWKRRYYLWPTKGIEIETQVSRSLQNVETRKEIGYVPFIVNWNSREQHLICGRGRP